MKHLAVILLFAAAAPCGAQLFNFGSRGFGGGGGRGPMVFRTPGGVGRFRPNVWLDLNTRSGARLSGPYNYRSNRFDYGNMWLTPNWGWQRQQQRVDEEPYNFDDREPRPAATSGWRKYMRQ